ncbi:RNA binding protein, heterogenous nuclear RNP-K like protein, partial [Cladochytrium tenue]
AYAMMAQYLLDNDRATGQPVYADSTTVRLLVARQLVGSIIGKGGTKIREIQEKSSAKLVISADVLPQSTERVIDIFGTSESIKIAVGSIAQCILQDQDRAVGTILYNPQAQLGMPPDFGTGGGPMGIRTGRFDLDPVTAAAMRPRRWDGGAGAYPPSTGRRFPADGVLDSGLPVPIPAAAVAAAAAAAAAAGAGVGGAPGVVGGGGEVQTQTLAVPIDMVGCIIGRGGSFISSIRRHSNARLHISEPENGAAERVVTITGTAEANVIALQMIHDLLESEKVRRATAGGAAGGPSPDGGADGHHAAE